MPPVAICLQGHGGPCPLLALANTLLLRRVLELPENTHSIHEDVLLSFLASLPNADTDERIIDTLPNLGTSVPVDVCFSGTTDFVSSPELDVFKRFHIRVVHGWLPDPHEDLVVDCISPLSYNQVCDRLVMAAIAQQEADHAQPTAMTSNSALDTDTREPGDPSASLNDASNPPTQVFAQDSGSAIDNANIANDDGHPSARDPPLSPVGQLFTTATTPDVEKSPANESDAQATAPGGEMESATARTDVSQGDADPRALADSSAAGHELVVSSIVEEVVSAASGQIGTTIEGSSALPSSEKSAHDGTDTSQNETTSVATSVGFDGNNDHHNGIRAAADRNSTTETDGPYGAAESTHVAHVENPSPNDLEDGGLVPDQTDAVVENAAVIQAFLDQSPAMLTFHGLVSLHETLAEGEYAVLFINNHFSVLTKHEAQLYMLATDAGYYGQSTIVWEHLSDIDGNTTFFDAMFRPARPISNTVPQSERPTAPSANTSSSTSSAMPSMHYPPRTPHTERPSTASKKRLAKPGKSSGCTIQ